MQTPTPTSTGASAPPMPEDLAPMLATLAAKLPTGPGWCFESKWDGVRAVAFIDGPRIRLTSRNRLDITHRYPEIVMGLAALMGGAAAGRRAILDGEIVALDADGRPSFERLQRRMNVADRSAVIRRSGAIPVCYMVFDLLWLGDRLLVEEPYEKRRQRLTTLTGTGRHVQVPPMEPDRGEAVLAAARKLGLEGVVAKRCDGAYRPGQRTPDWLKVKLTHRQEFVVGGWLPMRGHGEEVGALLLGYYDGPRFRYAGKVGTGFTNAERSRLKKLLLSHRRDAEPFEPRSDQRGAHWADPALVAEVEYREWTEAGSLRHPSYKGLRPDKPAAEVVREKPL